MNENSILKKNNVRVIGQGTKVILFAHGFGCDQSTWKFITDAFMDDYRLVLFDYVGWGKSDLSQYDQHKYATLEGYACDVIDIIEELKLTDLIFIGHSVSSMIGVIASQIIPEVFDKLIFIGPSPKYLNDHEYFGGFEREDLDKLFKFIASDFAGWSKAIAPLVMDNQDRPELTSFLEECFESADPKIALSFALATFNSDYRRQLSEVNIPSLTLQARQDIMAPISAGQYIQQNKPNNSLVILNATGHYPHISEPEETVAAIKSFLKAEQGYKPDHFTKPAIRH